MRLFLENISPKERKTLDFSVYVCYAGIVKENDIEFNKTLGTKILFLDYDGVICPLTKETRGGNYRPDNNIVLNSKKVCQETGAKIVWSTSWKNYNDNAVRTFRRINYKSPMPDINRIFASYLFEIPETDNLMDDFPDNPPDSRKNHRSPPAHPKSALSPQDPFGHPKHECENQDAQPAMRLPSPHDRLRR